MPHPTVVMYGAKNGLEDIAVWTEHAVWQSLQEEPDLFSIESIGTSPATIEPRHALVFAKAMLLEASGYFPPNISSCCVAPLMPAWASHEGELWTETTAEGLEILVPVSVNRSSESLFISEAAGSAITVSLTDSRITQEGAMATVVSMSTEGSQSPIWTYPNVPLTQNYFERVPFDMSAVEDGCSFSSPSPNLWPSGLYGRSHAGAGILLSDGVHTLGALFATPWHCGWDGNPEVDEVEMEYGETDGTPVFFRKTLDP